KRRGESPASTSKDDGAARQVSSETSTGGKGQKTKKGKKSGKGSTETRAGFEKGLAEYISRLPDSVALIVLVDETLEASNPLVKEARIFDRTDALAQRNQKQALTILHDLLADGEPPIRLISTIITQVRSLLLVKELSQKGMRASQIATTIGIAPFVAEKAARQVGKFTTAQLERGYRQLLATDAALK